MTFDTNLPSIVAVRAHIPEDAFTASGLGILREGSGVVIGEEGLVLTIGYLITEAETESGQLSGSTVLLATEYCFGEPQATPASGRDW